MAISGSISRKAILEALLLVAGEPLAPAKAAGILGIQEDEALALLEELAGECGGHRGIEIVRIAGGYRMQTRAEYADFVRRLLQETRSRSLSHSALETLAVVAYRQPVTRAQIEAIRGVRSDKAINTLLEYGLIRELGRKDAPGRPILYATTRGFLEQFGLADLSSLPPLPESPDERTSDSSG